MVFSLIEQPLYSIIRLSIILIIKAEAQVLGAVTSISLTNIAKKESGNKTIKLLTPYF